MITLVIALKSPKSTVSTYTQSGTKPNLVAKILAANFGVFFVIYVMFSKRCSMWV